MVDSNIKLKIAHSSSHDDEKKRRDHTPRRFSTDLSLLIETKNGGISQEEAHNNFSVEFTSEVSIHLLLALQF